MDKSIELRLSNLEKQLMNLASRQSNRDSNIESSVSNVDDKVQANETNISDTYTPRIYNVGEYTIYNNLLWECLVRNSSTPTEGAEWRQVSIAQMILDLNNRVTNLESEV